jgi:uncharacterized repeat protein (TIGR01451 family)
MKSTLRVKTALFAAGLALIAGSFFVPNTAVRIFAGPPLVITETPTIPPPPTTVTPVMPSETPVPPQPDFADPYVMKVCSMDTAKPGEDVTFIITAGNRGKVDAVNVQVRDTLPASLVLKSVTASRGQVITNGNSFIVDIGTLPVSEVITITVVATVAEGAASGAYTNVATLNTTSGGDNPNNNISLCNGSIGEIIIPPTGNDATALPIAMLSMGALLLAASLLVRNKRTA